MALASALSDVDQSGLGGAASPGSGRPGGPRANCWPIGPATRRGSFPPNQRIERAVLAFVVLGVLLRVGHYLANYPLWGDEAFLALSFLRRGYLDLLLPLEFGQVCPILFLWAELTAVKLFGFSEMSLRLCPLLCGVASVFLFRHVAGRLLNGPALLLAVAIFAVSIHPIRHSADAKPYASDLLVALGPPGACDRVACGRRGEPAGSGLLVGFVPLALAASYPAVLVAGGIGLALAPSVWKTRRRGSDDRASGLRSWLWRRRSRRCSSAICVASRGPGLLLALQSYWADSFPPLDSPVRLVKWLITTHAGSMFAYPGGGNRGASSMTLDSGAYRRGRFLAAAPADDPGALVDADGRGACGRGYQALSLRRPGAGSCSIAAPAICLLAGSGLSRSLGLPAPRDCPFAAASCSRLSHFGHHGDRLAGGRPAAPVPGHLRPTRPASSPVGSGPSRRETPSSPACTGTLGSVDRTAAGARTRNLPV